MRSMGLKHIYPPHPMKLNNFEKGNMLEYQNAHKFSKKKKIERWFEKD